MPPKKNEIGVLVTFDDKREARDPSFRAAAIRRRVTWRGFTLDKIKKSISVTPRGQYPKKIAVIVQVHKRKTRKRKRKR